MPRKLKYLGKRGEYVPGVPASDHTQENDKLAAELCKSGIYEYAGPKGDGDKQETGGAPK